MIDENKKNNYLLVYANVMYGQKGTENVGNVPVNAMVVTDEDVINQAVLGRAQQLAQVTFMKSMPEELRPTLHVVNVVIANIIRLGCMTSAEFFKTPEGLGMVQVDEPAST